MHKNTIKITMEMINSVGDKTVVETKTLDASQASSFASDYEFMYGVNSLDQDEVSPRRFGGNWYSKPLHFEMRVKLPTKDPDGDFFTITEYPAPKNQLVMVLLDNGKISPVDEDLDDIARGALSPFLNTFIYFVVDLP